MVSKMNRFERLLFLCCIIVISLCLKNVNGVKSVATTIKSQDIEQETEAPTIEQSNEAPKAEQRSITSHSGLGIELSQLSEDREAAFRKRTKPLKNIFMGIYKNYKSTYLGNKTITEYKRTLNTRNQQEENGDKVLPVESEDQDSTLEVATSNQSLADTHLNDEADITSLAEETKAKSQSVKRKKKKQRGQKRNRRHKKQTASSQLKSQDNVSEEAPSKLNSTYQYDFGPGVNMSLDMNNEIVNLRLDGDNLKDLMQGRWLKGKSEGKARGKKYEMITRVLPLFILPFLIQSAVVPFLVTKLKLLLMKSILVGKIAIFLLIISAIRNSSKMMQSYEVAPSYWAGEPSRRSELAAAASAAAYNGYRVEGKPTAWIN